MVLGGIGVELAVVEVTVLVGTDAERDDGGPGVNDRTSSSSSLDLRSLWISTLSEWWDFQEVGGCKQSIGATMRGASIQSGMQVRANEQHEVVLQGPGPHGLMSSWGDR